MINNSIYGLPQNITFANIWEEAADFLSDYKDSGIYEFDSENRIDDNHMQLLYYLLYSRYGNSSIASRDPNRFKYNVFSIIFQYAPAWVKKLNLQKQIRDLTLDDLSGGKVVYNHAYNPGTAPSTGSLNELTAINEQNTTNFKKSKAEALGLQWELIDTDVSNELLNRFKSLFIQIATPDYHLYYTEEE